MHNTRRFGGAAFTLGLFTPLLLAACGGEVGNGTGDDALGAAPQTPAPIGSDEPIIDDPTMSGGAGIPSAGGTGAVPQTEEEACGTSQSSLVADPVVLQLVVDTSRSMNEAPGGAAAGTPSKWVSTREALVQLEPTLASEMSLGLSFFPGTASLGNDCLRRQQAVAINLLGAAGSSTRAAFQSALEAARPDGGTPTQDAYEFGVQELASSTATGRKYLLLITDGIPTFEQGCSNFTRDGVDTAPLIQAAQNAYAQGISTFVIGSPGSENARESLSAIARAGGTAADGCSDTGPNYCHFDMTEEHELAAALQQTLGTITESIASCEYQIPTGATVDPARVNVLLETAGGEKTTVARDPSDTECNSGWQYAADGKSIQLCADTCSTVKADRSLRVQVLFGCQTQRGNIPLQF